MRESIRRWLTTFSWKVQATTYDGQANQSASTLRWSALQLALVAGAGILAVAFAVTQSINAVASAAEADDQAAAPKQKIAAPNGTEIDKATVQLTQTCHNRRV